MERIRVSPFVSLSHDLDGKRLRIDVELPNVDEKNISLDMKHDSFCITAPRNDVEYSGCFLLDHEVEPEKTETKFEDGVFRIFTPFKGWQYWDRIREGFMGRPIVNPVRNSSGALNPAGIILKSNPAAEQRGIISNGVKG